MKKFHIFVISFFVIFNFNAKAFDPSKIGDVLKDGTNILKQLEDAVDKKPQQKQQAAPAKKATETKSSQPAKQTESQTARKDTRKGFDGKLYRSKYGNVQVSYENEECINLDTKPPLSGGLKAYTRDELKKIKGIFKIGKSQWGLDFTTMEYVQFDKTTKKETREKISWSPIKLIDQAHKTIEVSDSKTNPNIKKSIRVAQCFQADAAFIIGNDKPGTSEMILFYSNTKGAEFSTVYGEFDYGDYITNMYAEAANKWNVVTTNTASLVQYEADKKAKALEQAKASDEAAKKRFSSRDNRGKWGLKFNMTFDEAEKVETTARFSSEYVNSKGETFWNCGEELFDDSGCKPDRVRYVSEIYKLMDTYTVSLWTKIFSSLKSKYKLISSPSAQEMEKFATTDGSSDPLVYLFENTKDPDLAKYITAKVAGCYSGGGLLCLVENQIFVGYVNSSVGKELLSRRNKKQQEIDDL